MWKWKWRNKIRIKIGTAIQKMASPGAQIHGDEPDRAGKPLKFATFFQRHELKFLNLSLLVYLCFGVFAFELLGEFNQELSSNPEKDIGLKAGGTTKKVGSLVELRELSARRMWNITNRLNILYESNWTRLMLDELQEFERQLLDKLTDEANREQANRASEQQQQDDDESDDDKDPERRKSKQSQQNRLRSLKKSLIHSLSTITTVGSSERIQSSAGKLATVIYGLLGIPLLFCSVAKTGRQVARSATNGLLVVRHYCFSLPVHYLCCACSLGACFRCLLWCCCCCCCFSYLCCCLSNDKAKNKCCDPSKAPKLRLTRRGGPARRYRRRTRGGTSRYKAGQPQQQQQQTAFVIGATPGGLNEDTACDETTPAQPTDRQQQHQKSVRFVSNSKKLSSKMAKQDDRDLDDDCNLEYGCDSDSDCEFEDEMDEFSYTQSVFLTSLCALSLYLLMGAYFYSAHTDSSLIDALFVCYSMLSTSKFLTGQPNQTDQTYSNPSALYEHLNRTATTTATTTAPSYTTPNWAAESIESEAIKWIYLLIGLNLISACGHFAQLWLSNKLRLAECPVAASCRSEKSARPVCNGQTARSMAGSSNQQVVSGATAALASIGGIMSPLDYNNLASHQHSIYHQQQPPEQSQVNLSELFLVENQNSPNEMQFVAGQAQPASDLSLTSERSTDRGSLCLHHHQAQHHGHLNDLYAHSSYNPTGTNQHHRNQSQSHLYLPNLPALECGAGSQQQQQQLGDHFLLSHGLGCDEPNEMDLMLKGCIDGGNSAASKVRSSSSSSQLSHLSGPLQHHQQVSGATNNSSSTLSRARTSFDKQNGHDSSLNDGSNTISSTASSRTVKLPHMRPNQHIGFILAPEHQAGLNKQQ